MFLGAAQKAEAWTPVKTAERLNGGGQKAYGTKRILSETEHDQREDAFNVRGMTKATTEGGLDGGTNIVKVERTTRWCVNGGVRRPIFGKPNKIFEDPLIRRYGTG